MIVLSNDWKDNTWKMARMCSLLHCVQCKMWDNAIKLQGSNIRKKLLNAKTISVFNQLSGKIAGSSVP